MATGIKKYSIGKGTRWKVRYYKADGGEGSKSGFHTEASAKAFLRELEHGRAQGNFIDPAKGKITLEVVARQWLADRKKATAQRNGKLTTLSRVTGVVEKHILPTLGKRQIGSITQADVDEWARSLTGEAETIRKNVSVLRGIMKLAVRSKLIPTNPVFDLTLPQVVRTTKRALTFDQVLTLKSAVDRTNDGAAHGYGLMVALLAFTGLRWSEIAGQRIDDIDLENRRLHVEHTVVLVDGCQVSGVPKTYAQREVPIPKNLIPALTEHIERRHHELVEDEAHLNRQLANVLGREEQINALRAKHTALTEYIAEIVEKRRAIEERIARLHALRSKFISTGRNYAELDASIARAHRKLDREPRPDVLTSRRDGIPAKIEKLQKLVTKSARQKEILEDHIAVLKQKPLFVGARTRVWLRNATFRAGWLTPAVQLMDAETVQSAKDAGKRPAKSDLLGDFEPHEFRHTFASIAAKNGADVYEVQACLGHEKASVTMDVYTHLFRTEIGNVADRLDKKFEQVWEERANAAHAPDALPVEADDPMWAGVPESKVGASEMRLI